MPLARSIAALLLMTAAAAAGPYSGLFVFGDSLSDVGNTDYWAPGDVPGDAYWNGRFSNGPVFAEWLAVGLGFAPLQATVYGGDNYAFGGAYTRRFFDFEEFFIDDFDTQISNYLSDQPTVDPSALHSILIGANNFLRGEQTNVTTPAGHVGDALADLAAAGATQFLVLNLPWMGLTPAHNGAIAEAQEWNQRARDYNTALASELDQFELSNAGVTVHRLDLAALLNDLIANAAARGFTNTTDSAAPGLEGGLEDYDQSQIAANPDEYLFWDNVHPTAAVHRLLGYEAVRAVLPAGDYDHDGQVTIADYHVWRDTFGSRNLLDADGNSDGIVDAADYTVWRDNLQLTPPTLAVPEPTTWFALLVALTAQRSRRRQPAVQEA